MDTASEPKTAEEWESRMFDAAFFDRDLEKAKGAFEEYKKAEGSAEKKLNCEIFYDYLRFMGGDTRALQDLLRLADNPEAKHQAKLYVARCYKFAGDEARAVIEFDALAADKKAGKYRKEAAIEAAKCVFKLDRREEAYGRMMAELSTAKEFLEKASIYRALAELYDTAKEPELRALALEKALEFLPNDPNLRFGAAFSYATISLHGISYLHYSRMLSFDPDNTSALNNIGVQCDELKMPLRSIAYYKRAFDAGYSLAAANLAFRYIGAGFREEAEKVLEAAKGTKDMHPNVGSAIVALSKNDEYEQTTDEKVRLQAGKAQHFFSQFAEAYFNPADSAVSFQGDWFSSAGYYLHIEHINGKLEGTWEEDATKKRFSGVATNRGVRVAVERMGYVLFSYPQKFDFQADGRGLLYFSPTDGKIHACFLQGDEEHYLTFGRLSQALENC